MLSTFKTSIRTAVRSTVLASHVLASYRAGGRLQNNVLVSHVLASYRAGGRVSSALGSYRASGRFQTGWVLGSYRGAGRLSAEGGYRGSEHGLQAVAIA